MQNSKMAFDFWCHLFSIKLLLSYVENKRRVFVGLIMIPLWKPVGTKNSLVRYILQNILLCSAEERCYLQIWNNLRAVFNISTASRRDVKMEVVKCCIWSIQLTWSVITWYFNHFPNPSNSAFLSDSSPKKVRSGSIQFFRLNTKEYISTR